MAKKTNTEKFVHQAVLPDLHAFAPGAHVLAQQQVVKGDGSNDVELLLHHLLDELGVGAVLAHSGVEGAELPQDGVEGIGALVCDAGRSLTETCGLHPRHALDGLVLQHARDCRDHTCVVSNSIMHAMNSFCYACMSLYERTYTLQHARTYHGMQDVLHAFNQLLVDLDGQVADHLSVLCQVEVGQRVFILL